MARMFSPVHVSTCTGCWLKQTNCKIVTGMYVVVQSVVSRPQGNEVRPAYQDHCSEAPFKKLSLSSRARVTR